MFRAIYRATTSAASETPRPTAPAAAKGVFTATATDSGSTRTLTWRLTFSGLSGKAVGAHVHRGEVGVAGAVLVPLWGPCTSGQVGTVKISTSAADALQRGLADVNVHAAKNAPGEIRGTVKLTGESGSAPATGSTSTGTTVPPDPCGGHGY
jgi:hypothetical protein